LNDSGDIVGFFVDTNFSFHGFLKTQSNFQSVDFPGAALTAALGINASGKIVGQYNDSDGVRHAFLAVPGPGNSGNTVPQKPAIVRHAPDKPICGSADLRQPAQSGLRAQPCKVHR